MGCTIADRKVSCAFLCLQHCGKTEIAVQSLVAGFEYAFQDQLSFYSSAPILFLIYSRLFFLLSPYLFLTWLVSSCSCVPMFNFCLAAKSFALLSINNSLFGKVFLLYIGTTFRVYLYKLLCRVTLIFILNGVPPFFYQCSNHFRLRTVVEHFFLNPIQQRLHFWSYNKGQPFEFTRHINPPFWFIIGEPLICIIVHQ